MADDDSTDVNDKTEAKNEAKSEAKPTIIVLVRHGLTPTTGKILPGRAPGLHLSEEGMGQAKEVGQLLSELDQISSIYSSPLERAQETASPLGQMLSKNIEVDDLLVECDFGEWTGKDLTELYKLPEWVQVQKSPSTFRFPNGESFTEMNARMSAFVEKVTTRHAGELVVAFSHADPIKVLLCSALGMHLDMFQRLMVNTCALSAISYSSSGPVVLGSNWQKNIPVKVP